MAQQKEIDRLLKHFERLSPEGRETLADLAEAMTLSDWFRGPEKSED
jgi:hypothetical protein